MTTLSFTETDRLLEKQDTGREALWVAQLDDGLTVYQDDGEGDPPSAWLRLGAYLRLGGKRIARLHLKFRARWLHDVVPGGARGYFFSRSASVVAGSPTVSSYLMGAVHGLSENGMAADVSVSRWYVPELERGESEERLVDITDERLLLF